MKAEGITKRGDSYYVAIRLGGGRWYRRSFPTQAAAIAARDKARDDARRGRIVPDARTSRLTVADVATEYLDATAPANNRSRRKRANDWRAIDAVFGNTPITMLRAADVQLWIDSAQEAPNTLGPRLGLLRAIIDHAVMAEMVPANVARTAQLRRTRRSGRKVAPALDDVLAWIDGLDHRYQIVAWLELGLGLRSGEARGLRLANVCTTTGRVLVDRQLAYTPGGGHQHEPPKADSAGRLMADARLIDLILAHVEQYGLGPDGEIASSSTGRALGETTWTSAMRRASIASDVKMTGHKLRHAFASYAIAAGHDAAAVSSDLRHSDPTTTWRYYVHPENEPTVTGSRTVMDRVVRKPSARGHLRAV